MEFIRGSGMRWTCSPPTGLEARMGGDDGCGGGLPKAAAELHNLGWNEPKSSGRSSGLPRSEERASIEAGFVVARGSEHTGQLKMANVPGRHLSAWMTIQK